MEEFKPKEVNITETIPTFKEPRLAPDERLYVEAYFITFSHAKAHASVTPGHKKYHNKNTFSKRESVQYHISKKTIKKASALALEADTVMDLLLQEATRLGNGSSPTARVQALTLLGKELGLFQEKKEEKEDFVFNVIQYGSSDTIKVEKDIPKTEIIEQVNPVPVPIQIEDYGEKDGG